jgi:hypothetical protein
MKVAFSRIGLFVAIVSAGLAAPCALAGDAAVDLWQMQKTANETFASHFRLIPQHRMSQIVQVRPEGRFLSLRTPLIDSGGEQPLRAMIDGTHGTGVISLRRDDRAGGLVEPQAFTFALYDFPALKKSTTVSATLYSPSRELDFCNSIIITNGPSYQVTFRQRPPSSSSGLGLVTLSVTHSRALGAPQEQLDLEAPDFFSFVQEYPAETEEHLRPMFRELQLDAVFAPDTMVAWQVFNDLWRPDPAFAHQVSALLPDLDAADYHSRDAAQLRLQRLGRDGAAVLLHLDRTHLSPEQNARVDCALAPYTRVSPKQAARLASDLGFLLDCLYSDNLDLRTAAFNRLKTMLGPGWQFDVNADVDTRSAAIRALRSRLVPSKLPSLP